MDVVAALSGFRRLVSGPSLPQGRHRAAVVAIAAQKGGVGKTTTAVHVAAGLAMEHGKRVLLVDLDAQAHCALSLRESAKPLPGESLGSLLLQKRRDLHELAQPSSIDGLFVVPSDRELNLTELQLAARIGKELLLRQALQVARTHYDAIIIDCPPNLGTLTANALVAADHVLVPCDLSVLGLDGVEAIFETILTVQDSLNPRLELLGLLRTRVDRRNQKVNQAIDFSLRSRFANCVLDSQIGTSTEVTKAQLSGRTVFELDPKGRAAQAYRELCAELERRLFGRMEFRALLSAH